MNETISKLLQPVSAEAPCGPDLSYDARFNALEANLMGKPEVEIGSVVRPAEPPDWAELRDKSVEFLGESKHLRVVVMLGCSLLKTAGLLGFADGLALLRGILEQFWPTLYPLLDPDDNNDPTQRLNILSALTARRGAVTGWLTVLEYLETTPLALAKGGPSVTFEQLQAARLKAGQPGDASAEGPDLAKLETALRAAGDQVAANHAALEAALESVHGIDVFLTNTLGAGNTISFDILEQTLQQMRGALKPYLPGAQEDLSQAVAAAAAGAGPVSSSGLALTGSVRSRQDVVRCIDLICEYYRQVEPSSPVPFLLRRAQKIATMNFVEAVQELNLASVDSLRPSLGSAVDSALPAPPAQE